MDHQLLGRILECERLPSFPAIAARVIEMCSDHSVSIRELGEVLSHDTAISTKMLRTINSSFYGLRHRVTTVERATAMLGISAVKMLALGFSLVPQLKGMNGEDFDPTIIWKRSLFASVGAHTIAREVKFDHHEEAFIVGLLQDLGVIVMLQSLRGEYVKVIQDVIATHSKLITVERQQLHLDHAEVGKALSEKWGLPEILVSCIGSHEDPEKAVPDYLPLVQSVALGAKAADCFICPEEHRTSSLKQYLYFANKWFDLNNDVAGQYLEQIQEGTRELGKLFEIESTTEQSASDLMLQANEALADLSVQSIQEAQELKYENENLSSQAHYDPLTSILNRGGLEHMLENECQNAFETSSPLSSVFIDADKFKPINDTYGHATGDKALQLIAAYMNECAPEAGRVGRYGGDEFMMILPGMDGTQAAVIAEKVRQRIQQARIEIESGEQVGLTVSIGISSYTGSYGMICQGRDLKNAADKAMYAAKGAGGNKIYHLPPIDQPQQKAG